MNMPNVPLTFKNKRLTHETLNQLAEAGFFYCARCQQVKTLDSFRKNAARKNGVRNPCKACEAEQGKIRNATPERKAFEQGRREYKRTYAQAHRKEKGKRPRRFRRISTVTRGLYVLRMGEAYKIGKSSNMHRRVAELQSLLPFPSELIHCIPVDGDLSAAEWNMHQQYKARRLNGEWFALTPDDIAEIKK